jgi:hypothetical protein
MYSRFRQAIDRCPPDLTSHEPWLMQAGSEADRDRLDEVLARPDLLAVYDTLEGQLGELGDTRHPERKLTPKELRAFVEQHLAGRSLDEYGTWVFYPWSKSLVHVLPEAEYRELRTSRNRNKITAEEQAKLRTLVLGIVGLSVGQATAVTPALEEVGGSYLLADFDRLELSNMNRLRAGVQDIGTNKAVLTAREIYEINPYARVQVFPQGIDASNIDRFLVGDRKLDILFEECDDLEMKIRLREKAREHRIPVLMETSDRGLIDVERFDLEPTRPILHGLVGDVRSDQLKGLTTYEKVPIVLRIIGAETLSGRMAASLIDVETSLKTWPQLASNVVLGGALNTDVARRLALGQFNGSGRYYVDLEAAINERVDGGVALDLAPLEVQPAAAAVELPRLDSLSVDLSDEQVRALVGYATSAPSGGNCQPWRFRYKRGQFACYFDPARSETLLDFERTASHLALGAAVENLRIAAACAGLGSELEVFPDSKEPDLACRVGLRAGATASSEDAELCQWIGLRATNRRLAPRAPLRPDHAHALHETVNAAGGRLRLLVESNELHEVGNVIAHGERLRLLNPRMHQEMMNEVRWSAAAAESTRDGLDLATLELTPTDLAGMRLISAWPLMELVGKLGAGRGLERPSRKAIAAASAVGLLTFPGASAGDWFQGGRVLQRLWLRATGLGLAFQPMTPLLYLFARVERGGGASLSPLEVKELTQLRDRFSSLFPRQPGLELMLFRVAHAGPPSARSLRRGVEDVLSIER